MKNNNFQIGFGIPQGGILIGRNGVIIDFEIYFQRLIPIFEEAEHMINHHQIEFFKPLGWIAPSPKKNFVQLPERKISNDDFMKNAFSF